MFEFYIPAMMKELNFEPFDSILDSPIEELTFTVRTYNCLKRAGIRTIGDLTDKNEFEVIKIRNMGKRGFDEIEEKLRENGLKLKTIESEKK